MKLYTTLRSTLKLTTAGLCLSLALGCAGKYKLVEARYTSQKHQHLLSGQSLEEIGPVTSRFCESMISDRGSVGLMDMAVKAALEKSGADFISEPVFYWESGCIVLEGSAQKIIEAPKLGARRFRTSFPRQVGLPQKRSKDPSTQPTHH